jgi:hypothetical protein
MEHAVKRRVKAQKEGISEMAGPLTRGRSKAAKETGEDDTDKQ